MQHHRLVIRLRQQHAYILLGNNIIYAADWKMEQVVSD